MPFRRPLALLLCAALVATPLPSRAEDEFRRALAARAQEAPKAPWIDPKPWPEGFEPFLKERGYTRKAPPENARALELYDEFRAASAKKPEPDYWRVPLVGDVHEAWDDAEDFVGDFFDGGRKKPAAGEPAGGDGKPKPERRGLRFQGIELGGGDDLETEQLLAPYAFSDALETALDWDVKARIRLDGLGLAARYRHPRYLRSLTISGRKITDVPDLVGLGDGRDGLYETFGRDKPGAIDGFEVGVAAVYDEHWGTSLSWKDKSDKDDDGSWGRTKTGALGVGFTPLGDNGGKPWNVTVVGGLNWSEVSKSDEDGFEEKDGVGWSLGTVFQHALHDVPIPWVNPGGGRHEDGIFLDRFTSSIGVSDSEISELTVRAAAGVSAYVTRHIRISCEAGVSCDENGDFDFTPRIGASVRF